jgi:hypothetical protein
MSRIAPLTDSPPTPFDLRIWGAIDALRAQVNDRVHAALPGERGAIAVALMTGDRGGIPQKVTKAMRDSGLAHVLAISGLHMVIMAGTVFWLVRALLALSPGLALRFPIKKWAAAGALLAAAFYLGLLTGSPLGRTRSPSCRACRAWRSHSSYLAACGSACGRRACARLVSSSRRLAWRSPPLATAQTCSRARRSNGRTSRG